jgi:hypothetical protein
MRILIVYWEWSLFNKDGTLAEAIFEMVYSWVSLMYNRDVEAIIKQRNIVLGGKS